MNKLKTENMLICNDMIFKRGDVIKLIGLTGVATGKITCINPDEVVLDMSERFKSNIRSYKTCEYTAIERIEATNADI